MSTRLEEAERLLRGVLANPHGFSLHEIGKFLQSTNPPAAEPFAWKCSCGHMNLAHRDHCYNCHGLKTWTQTLRQPGNDSSRI
jgi:hypothetical protein